MPKAAQHREIPPPLELECLKALWMLGEGSVKDVREVVTRSRNLAYTTVMTVLERLARRGGVARRKNGRFFLYSPLVDREVMCRLAVRQLVDTFFEGDAASLGRFLETVEVHDETPEQYQAAAAGADGIGNGDASLAGAPAAAATDAAGAAERNMDTALL